tara:strand:- start:48466 stop:49854 length:1389 start_codon:yes stop_codon:yes gene_type:complete
MKRFLLVLMLLSVAGSLRAQPQDGVDAATPTQPAQVTDLDALLDSVRDEQRRQRAANAQREQAFLNDKKRQQSLLRAARQDFERRQQANQPLLAKTKTNQEVIANLQQELHSVVEDMGDLSSTYSEFAGDFSAVLKQSMVSAQFPQRVEQLEALAAIRMQPTISDIEALWLLLQEEMTQAAKVTVFTAPVVTVAGTAETTEVLRAGTFSAFGNGKFLRYIPETTELLVLSRQPAARYLTGPAAFPTADGEMVPVTVDPTRGALLGMMSYTPSLRERIEQGGTIALIIIALGAIGLAICLWRGFYLAWVSTRMRSQLRNVEQPLSSNPLGRVLLSTAEVSMEDEELLQLKLDEAVLAEIPALERGNGVVKLLAATSPLLGLLGTVTGMILTFQAISLFGTSDPKLMAGGISQALVTTVLGLVVAIPLLFGHSIIAYMARSVVQRLDEQCAGVLARNAEAREGG